MLNGDDIRGLLAKVAPATEWSGVAADASLEEAGLDSLDKASFFLEVETASGARIPDDLYEAIDTIDGVLAALSGAG